MIHHCVNIIIYLAVPRPGGRGVGARRNALGAARAAPCSTYSNSNSDNKNNNGNDNNNDDNNNSIMITNIHIHIIYIDTCTYSIEPDTTPSPPTKSLGFRGFDSSKLLILRGGNSHVR